MCVIRQVNRLRYHGRVSAAFVVGVELHVAKNMSKF
jgi:hypothetical protein